MIIGVIQKRSLAELADLAGRVDTSLYDILELRLDACADLNLKELAAIKLPLPAIFTLRSQEEGGAFAGSEAERIALLERLAALQPAYLDIEAFVPASRIAAIRQIAPNSKIILSAHNFKETPQSLEEILNGMRAKDAEAIYKIAVMAQNTPDALKMLLFCKKSSEAGVPVIGISMGEYGECTRIAAPLYSLGFTYCPAKASGAEKSDTQNSAPKESGPKESGMEESRAKEPNADNFSAEELSAPGQLSAASLRELYNFASLNANTQLYGLLGDPVKQSIGHVYHNRKNRQAGLNALYVKWRLGEQDLSESLKLMAELGVRGCSVTMPLKEAVLPLIKTDAATRELGAVNTLRLDNTCYSGCNTDGAGALDAFSSLAGSSFSYKGLRLAVLGAGGAARAIVSEALKRGAFVKVYNRSVGKKMPGGLVTLPFAALTQAGGEAANNDACDLLINTLPFDCDFDFSQISFRAGMQAYDISYAQKSAFLAAAQAAGCATLDGAGMFEAQAELQRRFWGLN